MIGKPVKGVSDVGRDLVKIHDSPYEASTSIKDGLKLRCISRGGANIDSVPVVTSAALMVERILEASSALDLWLSSNRLRLNHDKTQYIWLGIRVQLAMIDADSLRSSASGFPMCTSPPLPVIFDSL